jgi:hypothetical protein
MAENIGIVCPVCGIKLRVLQNRVQIIFVAPFVLVLFSAVVLGRLPQGLGDDKVMLIGLGAVYPAGYLLFQKFIPRLLHRRVGLESSQTGPTGCAARSKRLERKKV